MCLKDGRFLPEIRYLCRMKWIRWKIALGALAVATLLLPGCRKQRMPDEWRQLDKDTRMQRQYVNMFAWNTMNTYYLWRDEVAPALEKWENWAEPIGKVAEVRYKDAQGNDIDRWTMLTDDYSSLQGGVSGHTRTLGMDFQLYYVDKAQSRICAVVTYTYAGSPARKAGLKRGDVVLSVDGVTLNMDNYAALLNEKVYDFPGTIVLGMHDGSSVSMTAVQMYTNPVLLAKTLDVNGIRVGYLHFTGFTLDACKDLVNVFRQFKADGIQELVLDLRYNSGGYVTTGQVLGSLIAPTDVVKQKAVFNKDIYNSLIGPDMDTETRFASTLELTLSSGKIMLNMLNANPDIARLWVLVTGQSASASESLICGLKPYMDVRLVGTQTYGKFCGGYLTTAESWYERLKKEKTDIDFTEAHQYTQTVGLYVIASRYTDCNGITLSMPDGIPVDYEAYDNPRDGFELGDPAESMLSVALGQIDGNPVAVTTKSDAGRMVVPFEKPGSGALLH